jgi:hypothetical protein
VLAMSEIKRGPGRPRIHPIRVPFQRYTRRDSVYDAIKILCKNGSDLKTIIAHSNKLYVKYGGNDAKETPLINITKNILDTLVEFELMVVNNKIFKLREVTLCQE